MTGRGVDASPLAETADMAPPAAETASAHTRWASIKWRNCDECSLVACDAVVVYALRASATAWPPRV
jgi:hypothetical protein